MLTRLANPANFLRFARLATPIAGGLALLTFPIAIYLSLIGSPAAEDHGQTVRILYVHVASAWSMMACYSALAIASLVYFVWRHPLADTAAKAIALPGIVMTALCLATGSLWGKPAWNTWWQWDGRMTSVLVLLLLYIGYFAVRARASESPNALRLAAIVAMVGAFNLPIIKFSVDWWASLHQPATLSSPGAPGLPAPLLAPLLTMVLAYTAFIAWFVLREVREDILHRAKSRQKNLPKSSVSVTELPA